MGLREDAETLLETLTSIAAGLGAFHGSPVQAKYVRHLHRRLLPLIAELTDMIGRQADRSELLRTMAEVEAVMHEVSGAQP